MTTDHRIFATEEMAKTLMARLLKLGIAAKITVNADGRFEVEPADDKHTCHWPGCDKPVPPAMWGCKGHWFTLPKTLRDRVWATYRRGQEITKSPSPEYMAVAIDVQKWIAQFQQNMRHPGDGMDDFEEASPDPVKDDLAEVDGYRGRYDDIVLFDD